MKLPFILPLALALAACDNVVSTPDPTPAPATPQPAAKPVAAATPPASPTPKPGAWMYESKSSLDRSGKLGEKAKK